MRIARESIESGGAKAAFDGFRDASKRAMGEDVAFTAVEDDGGVAARNGFVKSWLQMKRDGTETPDKAEQEKDSQA